MDCPGMARGAQCARCLRGFANTVRISSQAVQDAIQYHARGGGAATTSGKSFAPSQRLLVNSTSLQLTGCGAAVWLPLYMTTEFLFYYLNPADPPASILSAMRTLCVVVLISLTLQSAALAVCLSHSFHLVGDIAVHANANTNTNSSTAAARQNRVQTQRVFTFLMIQSLAACLVVGGLLYAAVYLPRRLTAALAISAATCAIPLLMTTGMTIPAMLLENCTISTGMARSVAITCRSSGSCAFPVLSFAILNAMWTIPLAVVYWPPPVVLLFITWIVASWNMILLRVVWDRLVADHDKQSAAAHEHVTPPIVRAKKSRPSVRTMALLCAGVLFCMASAHISLSFIRSFRESTSVETTKKVWFSPARADLTGAQSLEMLLHNAYAHHHGATYGGACVEGSFTQHHHKANNLFDRLGSLGVQQFLKYGCPPNGLDDPSIVWGLLPWILAKHIVSADWLQSVRSRLTYPARNESVFKIAVHIRRGDISPCTGDKIHKYLPNSFYLDMIDRYKALAELPEHKHKTVEVVIHSMAISFEPLDVFYQRNYTMKQDKTPLEEVWTELMTADVFIMSQSGFSVVPALLNHGGVVVFPPYLFFEAAPGWHSVDVKEMRRYKREAFDFLPSCNEKGKTKRYRIGKSGVWYLLRNFGVKGFIGFFNPN